VLRAVWYRQRQDCNLLVYAVCSASRYLGCCPVAPFRRHLPGICMKGAMPRRRYYRKRPGHRAYVASLWRALRPFLESSARVDTSALQSDGLSSEQIDELRAILAELGALSRIGLGVGQLPETPPDFFAIGAEMPASRFTRPLASNNSSSRRAGLAKPSSGRSDHGSATWTHGCWVVQISPRRGGNQR
jgi:hypothetical protein